VRVRALRHTATQRLAELRREDGSLLPLTIFYGFLSLVLILLVVAATSLYFERKRLFTLADGAALVGAEAFALDEVSVTAGGPRPTLRSEEVRSAVAEYLDAVPHDRFESLRLESASATDRRSATVQLSAYWRPPVLSLLLPEGIRLDVSAVGRSVFG
jgi:hypothetical protein